MSGEELRLRNLLKWSEFYLANADYKEGYREKSKECLDETERIIVRNTREKLESFSMELILNFIEISLKNVSRDKMTEYFLDLFLQKYECQNQFYIRALFAYALVEGRKLEVQNLKGEKAVEQVKKALEYIRKGISIINTPQNAQKYLFLLYNASISIWNVIRPLMRPGWAGECLEVIQEIFKVFFDDKGKDDVDYELKSRFLMLLAHSLAEAEKKPEAPKPLDTAFQIAKLKDNGELMETILRLRIHAYKDNSGMQGTIRKDAESLVKFEFKNLCTLQQIKSGFIPEAQIEKEVLAIFSSICQSCVEYSQGTKPIEKIVSSSLRPIQQDRLAEAGRLAIKYGFISKINLLTIIILIRIMRIFHCCSYSSKTK